MARGLCLIWIKPAYDCWPIESSLNADHGPAGTTRMDTEKRHPTAFQQARSGDEVIQIAIRLGLLAFLIYWSFIILRPFIPILVWSAVLSVALYPAYDWLSTYLGKRPRIAACILTIVVLAVFLGPAAWLGVGLVDGLREISDQLAVGDLEIPSPPDSVKDWPLVGTWLHDLWETASVNFQAAFRQIAPYLKPLAGPILAIAGSVGTGALKFFAAVVIAGFLLPSGPGLVVAIRNILVRIVPHRSADFVALAGATIRTVAQGVIGIAVLQALLAGIGLKIAGVPHTSVLAFAILILGIVQIGSGPILIPVIIWICTVKD